jgi:predicted CXXCH cytochrome family protein
MAERKQYIKAGLATASGLILLGVLAFETGLWRTQKAQSPHYRADACMVCHTAEDTSTLKADELALCTSCHEREGDVIVPNSEGESITVDLGLSHPFGVPVTASNAPATLPLNNGAITCQTCHDVHLSNVESHMLRLYGAQANGLPDWTPLCHDCHPGY